MHNLVSFIYYVYFTIISLTTSNILVYLMIFVMLFPEALRRPILGYCITICGEFMYVFSTRESIFSLRLSLPEKEYLSGLLFETIG